MGIILGQFWEKIFSTFSELGGGPLGHTLGCHQILGVTGRRWARGGVRVANLRRSRELCSKTVRTPTAELFGELMDCHPNDEDCWQSLQGSLKIVADFLTGNSSEWPALFKVADRQRF